MNQTTTPAEDPASNPYRVEANADKALFVSMLVKDIELLPAIIDLVDNSVDGARAMSPDDFSHHQVVLRLSSDSFEISDDCGGIDLDVARKYAFRFGRPAEYDGVPGSVGQFGIGMKRALFKLGTHFTIDSRANGTSFTLSVDVPSWLEDEDVDWQFIMDEINDQYDPAEGRGTKILVSRLHPSVSDDFADEIVLSQLREQIRLSHLSALHQVLKIVLNGEQLTGFAPRLLSGPGFEPVNKTIRFPVGDSEVFCRVVAGVVATTDEEDSLDDGQAEDFDTPGDAGWWLFCNDRLLLVRERSRLTGWGDSTAAYHPQFRRFRGYVYLTSLDPFLLPWNTTKTSVDQDSKLWRKIRSEMVIALSQVQSVINRMKTEKRDAEEDDGMPITLASRAAKSTLVKDLNESQSFVTPQPKARKPSLPKPKDQRIQYVVPVDKFNEMAALFGVSTGSEVGRETFDYVYTNEFES